MPEVRLDPAVDDRLDTLWSQGQETLVGRLEDAIDWIAAADPRSRAHRFLGPDRPDGAWVIAVQYQGEAWLIVWTEEPDNVAFVHDVGRSELL